MEGIALQETWHGYSPSGTACSPLVGEGPQHTSADTAPWHRACPGVKYLGVDFTLGMCNFDTRGAQTAVAFPLIVKPERVSSGARATYMVLTQVHTGITSHKSH